MRSCRLYGLSPFDDIVHVSANGDKGAVLLHYRRYPVGGVDRRCILDYSHNGGVRLGCGPDVIAGIHGSGSVRLRGEHCQGMDDVLDTLPSIRVPGAIAEIDDQGCEEPILIFYGYSSWIGLIVVRCWTFRHVNRIH